MCALLTDAEVADVLGAEVNHLNLEATGSAGPGCVWNRADNKTGAGVIGITMLTEFDVTRLEDRIGIATRAEQRDFGDGALVTEFGVEVLVAGTGFTIGVAPLGAVDADALQILAMIATGRV